MWAVPTNSNRPVAIHTKKSVTLLRPTTTFQIGINLLTDTQTMLFPIAIYVIERQKLGNRLTTTPAFTTICSNHLSM